MERISWLSLRRMRPSLSGPVRAGVALLALLVMTGSGCSRRSPSHTAATSLVMIQIADTEHAGSAAFRRTLTDQALVKDLYGRMLRLPPYPTWPSICLLSESPASYRLTFLRGSRVEIEAEVFSSSCSSPVRLSNGQVLDAATQPGQAFLSELGIALGRCLNCEMV
jgi:hypothetical protein